jgi:hypothetical protein
MRVESKRHQPRLEAIERRPDERRGDFAMSLATIADAMGVPLHSLEELLEGRSTAAIASRLRTGSELVQEFIDGHGSAGVASAIGAPTVFVQDLRERLGRGGAIGLLVGLCTARRN